MACKESDWQHLMERGHLHGCGTVVILEAYL